MKYRLAHDARPQAKTLLLAAAISVALWFIPYAEILSYPFRIFVTFIHEGGHAIAALLTGNSVESLSVAMNASGETYTTQGGTFSQMFVSSAGYLGAMSFGALLLVLIRRAVAARIILFGSAGVILLLTTVFGFIKPIFSASWGGLTGIPFTLFAGMTLSLALFLLGKFTSTRVAMLVVSMIAIQCVLNALLDLKTVFFLSSPFAPSVPNDALNMATATGVPAIFWALLWIALAFGILILALRLYVSARDRAFDAQKDLPFEGNAEA
jgi:Peptidase M50B-like